MKATLFFCIWSSFIFGGCNSGDNYSTTLNSGDRKAVRPYESLAELKDTLIEWGYQEYPIIEVPDSIQALFGHGFKLLLINDQLKLDREICEADFPGLRNRINVNDDSRYSDPNQDEYRLITQSMVSSLSLKVQIERASENFPIQAIVINGFYDRGFLESRMIEIEALFGSEPPPIYFLPTRRFSDANMSEYEFLSIRYKHWENQGFEIPEIARRKLDSLKNE